MGGSPRKKGEREMIEITVLIGLLLTLAIVERRNGKTGHEPSSMMKLLKQQDETMREIHEIMRAKGMTKTLTAMTPGNLNFQIVKQLKAGWDLRSPSFKKKYLFVEMERFQVHLFLIAHSPDASYWLTQVAQVVKQPLEDFEYIIAKDPVSTKAYEEFVLNHSRSIHENPMKITRISNMSNYGHNPFLHSAENHLNHEGVE